MKICKFCNAELSRLRQSEGAKFCNKKCYGRWLSINATGKNNSCWRGGPVFLICPCGNPFCVSAALFKSQGAKYCTQKCAANARVASGAFKGQNHPNWKGGKDWINNSIRHSIEYKEWRLAVWRRDGFKCQQPGCKGRGKISAHHIHRFETHPELRFSVNNGITLCWPCHQEIRGREEANVERFLQIILP